MELINKIRKSRKGFTLVEIIVVLVILAILAAFTIPAMLGFVNDAKGKAYIAEAREVYVAAQATATEMSATGKLTDEQLTDNLNSKAVVGVTAQPATFGVGTASYQMRKYLETALGGDMTISSVAVTSDPTVTSLGADDSAWTVTVGADNTEKTGKVKTLVYYKNGYKVTISEGNSAVSKLAQGTP